MVPIRTIFYVLSKLFKMLDVLGLSCLYLFMPKLFYVWCTFSNHSKDEECINGMYRH